jgi:hypothetical protein
MTNGLGALLVGVPSAGPVGKRPGLVAWFVVVENF